MSLHVKTSFALLALLSCSTAHPPVVAPSEDHASGDSEAIEAHLHGVVPSASLTHGLHQQLAPNTAGILKHQGTATSSYDASAPATVLVTTPWGHGSGVLVDPRGRVLTN